MVLERLQAFVLLLVLGIPWSVEGGTPFTRDVCGFFARYRTQPQAPQLKKHQAERYLGEVCKARHKFLYIYAE
jgi:hypothetical protein